MMAAVWTLEKTPAVVSLTRLSCFLFLFSYLEVAEVAIYSRPHL